MTTIRRVHASILAAAMSASPACATIGHGVRQDIRVVSEPSGAVVSIGSKVIGPTPTVVTVWRQSSPTIRLEMDGFQALTVPLKKSVSGLTAGNVIALNPFSCQGLNGANSCPGLMIANLATSFGIDFLTGAAFEFPKEVRAVLTRR